MAHCEHVLLVFFGLFLCFPDEVRESPANMFVHEFLDLGGNIPA